MIPDSPGFVIAAVVLVVLAVVTLFVVRRQRYVRALRGRGWRFDSRPALEATLDHQAPPFGIGFVRTIDELVSGLTTTGVPFRIFEYTAKQGGPTFDQRVASLGLPLPLPEVFLTAGAPRTGVRFASVEVEPGLHLQTGDATFAAHLLSGPFRAALAAYATAGHQVDLSIDGAQLVAVGAPKKPAEVAAYLESLALVAQAVDGAALQQWRQSPPMPGWRFYSRPDWVLIGRDDSLITTYDLTTAGYGHCTEQLVRGHNDGLPIDAFVHRWKTDRIETSTDSEGRTTTRTVTEQHSEVVANVALPFAFPPLSVNARGPGAKRRFESETFNHDFQVRTESPKLASDVIHPRMMEFLQTARPPAFRIEGPLMRFSVSTHDTLLVGFCADLAHEFFGRVPSFVWKDLGVVPPPFRMGAG